MSAPTTENPTTSLATTERWVQEDFGFATPEPEPRSRNRVSPRSRRLDRATRRRNLAWVRRVRADLTQRDDAA